MALADSKDKVDITVGTLTYKTYVTLAEADQVVNVLPAFRTAWARYSDDDKGALLVHLSDILDENGPYIGDAGTAGQAYPRNDYTDPITAAVIGNQASDLVVPGSIRTVMAEAAGYLSSVGVGSGTGGSGGAAVGTVKAITDIKGERIEFETGSAAAQAQAEQARIAIEQQQAAGDQGFMLYRPATTLISRYLVSPPAAVQSTGLGPDIGAFAIEGGE